MSDIIIYTVITLSALGAVAAVVLFFIAKKFKVYEDPRIDQVEEILPAANCGGCGFPGCRGFAEALVKADDLSDYNCPVGGNDMMAEVAKVLGKEIEAREPQIAVVKCNGTPEHRKRKTNYEGASSCAVAHSLYTGETDCPYGCLGEGDCVEACDFDAIYMDNESGLPIVKTNCVACGACITACPRNIIELRNVGKKERRIFVSCVNKDKGAPAKKACAVACIGCGKCVKECPFDAITLENNLAYIDYEKCKLCRKCEPVCPTNSITEVNFPPRKPKPAADPDKVKEAAVAKPNIAAAKKEAATVTKEPVKDTESKETPKAEEVKKETPATNSPKKEDDNKESNDNNNK
jgi:RnfABCDGE-type electron transport complex B subunit